MISLRNPMFSALAALALAASWAATAGLAAAQQSDSSPSKAEQVQQLLATLQSAEASLHDKAVACEQLAVLGDASAVPVLASLLDDPKLSHYARFGLEPIPDPSVDEALRAALGRLQGRLLVGVINSIGQRGDRAAIGALARLLQGADPAVASAAAGALGRIATPRTARLLKDALADRSATIRADVADACLACAEQLAARGRQDEALALVDAVLASSAPKHLHEAAVRAAIVLRGPDGLELLAKFLAGEDDDLAAAALGAARELGDPKTASAVAKLVGQVGQRRAARLLALIGDLGDDSFEPLVVRWAQSGSPAVRAAAIRALEVLEAADAAPLLIEALGDADAEVAQAARQALERIPGEAVDQAVLGALRDAKDAVRVVLVELAGARRLTGALPVLLDAADSGDPSLRLAAIRAIGETADVEKLPWLIDRLVSASSAEQRRAAGDALRAACQRMADRDGCAGQLAGRLSDTRGEARQLLLELLNAVGGRAALQAVADAARSSDRELQDAATQVLGEWMSPEAGPVLLELATTLSDRGLRVRTLRGFIRIPRQFGLPNDQRLAMCRQAMAAAERVDEKRLVLQVLERIVTVDSLREAVAHLADPQLKGAAARTAVRLAGQLAPEHPQAVAAAMRQVAAAGVAAETAAQARALLEKTGG